MPKSPRSMQSRNAFGAPGTSQPGRLGGLVAAPTQRAEQWCVAAVLIAVLTSAQAQADDAAQQQFLTSCGVCHSTEKVAAARQGPNLYGVIGRKAGQQSGFQYSQALAASGLVWDEATLDRWIEDAPAVVPGTVMPYRQANPDKRRLIVQYLATLKP